MHAGKHGAILSASARKLTYLLGMIVRPTAAAKNTARSIDFSCKLLEPRCVADSFLMPCNAGPACCSGFIAICPALTKPVVTTLLY